MVVRRASIIDLESLFYLNKLFGNTTTMEEMKKSILENDREIICISYTNGIAIGYCTGLITRSMCYSDQRIDIEALYVINEYRRQGVGGALIQCLEREAVFQDIHHMHINTDATNIVAQALYEKIGYSKTGEILLDKTIMP